MNNPRISPCIWLDSEAEEAANFYVSVFPDSRVTKVSWFGEEGKEIHGKPVGSVMAVEFVLSGLTFTALNGGPMFKLTEAVSFQIPCETQDEVDHYWNELGAGGDPAAQQCGWLKDRFGLSWQVVPRRLGELLSDPDAGRAQRVMKSMLSMRKLDIAELERAADAETA